MGAKLPTARKTGTTIAGIVFKVRFDLPVIGYFALISDRFFRKGTNVFGIGSSSRSVVYSTLYNVLS